MSTTIDTINKVLDYVLARLGESSTWRGLVLFATALGINIEPELQTQILTAGLSVVAIINILRKSKTK